MTTIEPERIVGDAHLWAVAEAVCTPLELSTLRALGKGLSYRHIAAVDQVTHSVIGDRKRNATRKILQRLREEAA